MLKDLFSKKKNYGTIKENEVNVQPNIPSGMWDKCSNCNSILYHNDLEENGFVCSKCNSHFKLKAYDRIKMFLDENSFKEICKNLSTKNPLKFKGYDEKLEKAHEATESSEAVVTGIGKVNGVEVGIGVMDSHFMMGSMGTVVGEKLTRLIEESTRKRLPLIIFTASGGARMQEGIFSLMQMAKISAALAKHSDEGLLYITVLTYPTTGGVTASFAMEGDIILSEPEALIGFAGRRVIENTIKEKLPEDFQTAEFLLEKGFVDKIIERKDLRTCVYKILRIHGGRRYE